MLQEVNVGNNDNVRRQQKSNDLLGVASEDCQWRYKFIFAWCSLRRLTKVWIQFCLVYSMKIEKEVFSWFQIQSASFSHVPRACNSVTRRLARFGLWAKPSNLLMSNSTSMLSNSEASQIWILLNQLGLTLFMYNEDLFFLWMNIATNQLKFYTYTLLMFNMFAPKVYKAGNITNYTSKTFYLWWKHTKHIRK